MRSPGALFATLVLSACSSSAQPPMEMSPDAGTASPDAAMPTCPQGQEMDEYGCAPILPAGDCPPGTVARLGERDCQPVGRSTPCPDGFTQDPTSFGCTAILPEANCPPGTSAALGLTDCRPTGWTSCASPFRAVSNGWGCEAIVPSTTCTGATRAALGATTCAALGDCNATSFPPAGATLFVDPSAHPDATHFQTIQAALDAATEGAVIAVERGTYPEALVLHAAVTLAGRCAEQTIVEGASLGDVPGLLASGQQGAVVTGLSFLHHLRGVRVDSGGHLALDAVRIEDARAAGISADGALTEVTAARSLIRGTGVNETGSASGARAENGARLALDEVELAGTVGSGLSAVGGGSVISGHKVFVHDSPQQNHLGGAGASAQGGSVELADSALIDSARYGVISAGAGSFAGLERVVIRSTDTVYGAGNPIAVSSGGTLTATAVHLAYGRGGDALIEGTGSTARLAGSVVERGLHDDSGIGGGIMLRSGGHLELIDSAVVDNTSFGVAMVGAGLHALRSRIGNSRERSGLGTIVGQGSTAELEDCFVGGSGADAFELQAQDPHTVVVLRRVVEKNATLAVLDGARLELEQCALVDSRDVAIFSDAMGTELSIRESVLERTRSVFDPQAGEALLVGAMSHARVEDSDLANNQSSTLYVEAGARIELARTNLRGSILDTAGKNGTGADVSGVLTAEDCAFYDNTRSGLFLREGGTAEMILRSAFQRNGLSGVFAHRQTNLVLEESTVEDTHPLSETGELGQGLLLGGELTATHTLFRRNVYAAIALDGSVAPDGLTANIQGSVLEDTIPDVTGFGHGLIAGNGARVYVTDTRISGNASVGLAFTNASAVIESSLVAKNAIGVHVQDGSMLREAGEAPAELAPTDVFFLQSTRLIDNGTRIGADPIPPPELFTE